MYNADTKKWSCDYCTEESGNIERDKTRRVMVANVIIAEVCASCEIQAITAIAALRTGAADEYYGQLDEAAGKANLKRFGPAPKEEE